MKKISKIEPAVLPAEKRKKAAVYARVSRDTRRLQHSVSAQIGYYRELISKNPDWEYAGVYADCGVTGTLTVKRSEFQRMLADCEAGKIDIILTKSISRFARNTVDLLETVRHLKLLGIEVRFEKEQIHSLSAEGELMLSLLASFAQEESRSISGNIKWGLQKRYQSGEIKASNKHILGYQYDEEQKKYVVIPEEAETVRRMFQLYLQGISLRKIASTLNQAGHRTVNGCRFTEVSVNSAIHNEIYAGDLRRQKYFVEDPISKRKIPNRGCLPQYYIQDCHEAVLDRETYAKVQDEIARRAALARRTCCFSGKIRCGICGNHYIRKKSTVKGRTYVYWVCRGKKTAGMTCTNINLKEEELKQNYMGGFGREAFDEKDFESQVREILVLRGGALEFCC